MKKLISLPFLLVLLFGCAGNRQQEAEMQNVLTSFWMQENFQHAAGAVDCNVFSAHVTKENRDTITVSYSLRSTYAGGNKTFVNFKDAKVVRDADGTYRVIDCGYDAGQ